MRRLVDHGREQADPSFFFREFAAPPGCAVDHEAAWKVANPALDDSCTATRYASRCPPDAGERLPPVSARPVGRRR